MDISNCKGCKSIIYASNKDKSWCWELAQDIKDIEKCPIDHVPQQPKGRKQGWSSGSYERLDFISNDGIRLPEGRKDDFYDERYDQEAPRAED